jgi:hypothetical protein
MTENDTLDETLCLSAEGAKEFLQYRIPVFATVSGIAGASVGYHIGDMAALYGYSYFFSSGLFASGFFGGAYLLRSARQKDDYVNYMLSGGCNVGLITTLIYAPKRGLIRAAPLGVAGFVGGAMVGAAYKVGGDAVYGLCRDTWRSHRERMLSAQEKNQVVVVDRPGLMLRPPLTDSENSRRYGPGKGSATKQELQERDGRNQERSQLVISWLSTQFRRLFPKERSAGEHFSDESGKDGPSRP